MQFKNRPDLREHKRQIHGYSNNNNNNIITATPPRSANELTTTQQHFFGDDLNDENNKQQQQNVAQLLKDFSMGQVQIAHLNGLQKHDQIPSSSSSLIYETALSATSTNSSNNNLSIFKCRFCDAQFNSESKLQYHRAEHVACILSNSNDNNQILRNDENDLVLQVAHKMIQNNKVLI